MIFNFSIAQRHHSIKVQQLRLLETESKSVKAWMFVNYFRTGEQALLQFWYRALLIKSKTYSKQVTSMTVDYKTNKINIRKLISLYDCYN